jgi:hypothetical protein
MEWRILNNTMKKYPIWLVGGRDASAYKKAGESKVKTRPWKAGEFDTPGEAEAFRQGIIAAIGGGLRSVTFIDESTAKKIDERVVDALRKEYPHLNINYQ